MKIKPFLDARRIPYRSYQHEVNEDLRDLPKITGIPECNFAATVLIRADEGYNHYLVIYPLNRTLDLVRLSQALGGAHVRQATLLEVADFCPDCDLGILPPFGSQFNVETLVDESLGQHEDLFFRGDSHQEIIRLKYSDFINLEHPTVVHVTKQESRSETTVK